MMNYCFGSDYLLRLNLNRSYDVYGSILLMVWILGQFEDQVIVALKGFAAISPSHFGTIPCG